MQQYGLWDHEGPLDEKSASKEQEKTAKEGKENGKKKKEKEVQREDYTFSTSSTLEDLDKIEKNPFEQVGAGIISFKIKDLTPDKCPRQSQLISRYAVIWKRF